jgi:hypothetical protein
MTTKWFLAPVAHWPRLPLAAAWAYSIFPTGVEPTNENPSVSGSCMSALTTSASPWTRLITPGGKPHCSINSKMRTCEIGTIGLGLTI